MTTETPNYEAVEKRRPRVEIAVTKPDDGWMRSAVRMTLTRAGVEIDGWYDTFVGMDTVFVPWDEFDKLRERLA